MSSTPVKDSVATPVSEYALSPSAQEVPSPHKAGFFLELHEDFLPDSILTKDRTHPSMNKQALYSFTGCPHKTHVDPHTTSPDLSATSPPPKPKAKAKKGARKRVVVNNGPPLPPPPPGYPDPRPFQYLPVSPASSTHSLASKSDVGDGTVTPPTLSSKNTSPAKPNVPDNLDAETFQNLVAFANSELDKYSAHQSKALSAKQSPTAKSWWKPSPKKHCKTGTDFVVLVGKCKQCMERDEALAKLNVIEKLEDSCTTGQIDDFLALTDREKEWLGRQATDEMQEKLGLENLSDGAQWI